MTEDQAVRHVPPTPDAAVAVFGSTISLAERYVAHLATTGVAHGLLGPREVDRLWERHVLNCAVLTEVLPKGTVVADVGTGAGLPGLTLAIRRPDLHLVLIEPLLRRVGWLEQVVADLELTNVEVRRARAEELVSQVRVPVVTARAVAPLLRLAQWGLPLVQPGGQMLAIKGQSAADELDDTRAILEQAGVTGEVIRVGQGLIADPTIVVRLDRGSADLGPLSPATPSRGRRRRARRRP